jgi:putative copper resistance protein D
VARPGAPRLGDARHGLLARCRFGIAGASLALALFALLSLGSDLAALIEILGFERADPLHAEFVRAGMVQAGAGVVLAALVLSMRRPPAALLLLPALAMLGASTATSHAAARLQHQGVLEAVTFLHEGAASTWIGALPYLLACLWLPIEGKELHPLGRRFHGLAVVGVGTLFAGAAALCACVAARSTGCTARPLRVMVGVRPSWR